MKLDKPPRKLTKAKHNICFKTSHETKQEAQVHKYSESNTPRDIEIKSKKIAPITELENLEGEKKKKSLY